MAARRRQTKSTGGTAAAGSWLALLAATTLGNGAGTVNAEVRADRGLRGGAPYRLVVQSYDQTSAGVPSPTSRPVGSVQRAVTAQELRDGVRVNLLELRASEAAEGGASTPLIVAWIEAGDPDLEFDGRTARPQPGSMYGSARRGATDDAVQIRLDRIAA